MDDFAREMEALFLRFIHVEDASETMDVMHPERLRGKWWGWFVHEDALALDAGYVPDWPVEFQGIKTSREEATNAAIGYIWKCRGDLVQQCRDEASKGRAYRRQIAEGRSGMAIQ